MRRLTRHRVKTLIRDDRTWWLTALVANPLFGWSATGSTNLAWFIPLLLSLGLVARLLDHRGITYRPTFGRRARNVIFAVVSWACGMMIELAISNDGTGYGGLHEDTKTSFILAQGYYVVAPLIALFVIRRYGLTTRQAFFFAGAFSIYEQLLIGLPTFFSLLFPLAPLAVAYYVAVYALIGTGGFLVVDLAQLHGQRAQSISMLRLLIYGVIAGGMLWLIYGIWGGLMEATFGLDV